MALPKTFEDVGIPEGYTNPEVYYHEARNMLILIVRAASPGLPADRLMVRTGGHTTYVMVSKVGGYGTSIQSILVASRGVAIYLLCFTWSEVDNSVSGNWRCIVRVDLNSLASKELLNPRSIVFPPEYRGAHVVRLLSLCEESHTINALVGFDQMDGTSVFFISKIFLDNSKVEPMRNVEAVFA
jgi:hypothetical protein